MCPAVKSYAKKDNLWNVGVFSGSDCYQQKNSTVDARKGSLFVKALCEAREQSHAVGCAQPFALFLFSCCCTMPLCSDNPDKKYSYRVLCVYSELEFCVTSCSS